MYQATSIDFLSKQDFDFNQIFREGVSNLRPDEEDKLREALAEMRRNRLGGNTPNGGRGDAPMLDEQKAYLRAVINCIDDFLRSAVAGGCIDLDRSNAFQRKLVSQVSSGGSSRCCLIKSSSLGEYHEM
jgi:hypothetical protein